jgi:hypothetical protein
VLIHPLLQLLMRKHSRSDDVFRAYLHILTRPLRITLCSIQEEVYLTEPYKNHPSKIFSLIFITFMTATLTPIFLLIVKYEREKSNRTLINQLLSSVLVWPTFLSIVDNFLLVIRFMPVGNPKILCYLDLILKPSATMYCILFLDAILIVRYIFIFHTKNPTVTQDDFWNCFLCIWLFGLSFISHFVFAILPGNNPNHFYVCLGSTSQKHKNEKTKENLVLLYVLVFSAVAHIFVAVRYLIFKHNEKKTMGPGSYLIF